MTARTWGETHTLRNFEGEGDCVVQFTHDPVTFVEAALGVREIDQHLLEERPPRATEPCPSGAGVRRTAR